MGEGQEGQGEDAAEQLCEILSARWAQIWSSRRRLMSVARRCGCSVEDAEDVVHEAMLRAAEHPEIDEDRLGGWLCVVTQRLCIDGHRRRAAETRRWERTSTQQVVVQLPGHYLEEQVCERSEAAWLASLASEVLPPRQIEALWLTAAGYDVQQVANCLGVRYRAAESLLARGRRTLRALLLSNLGAGGVRTVPDRLLARSAG